MPSSRPSTSRLAGAVVAATCLAVTLCGCSVLPQILVSQSRETSSPSVTAEPTTSAPVTADPTATSDASDGLSEGDAVNPDSLADAIATSMAAVTTATFTEEISEQGLLDSSESTITGEVA